MKRIKLKILVLVSIFFTTLAIAQVESLNEYDITDIDNNDIEYSTYRIKGEKYYLHYNKTKTNEGNSIGYDFFLKGKDTIYSVKYKDITCYTIYKKRYLFISYYPKELENKSYGCSILRLGKVDVIDLKNPSKKWYFNIEKDLGVSLGGISEFKPKTGEIVFMYKFSVDTKNETKSIPVHKNDGKY